MKTAPHVHDINIESTHRNQVWAEEEGLPRPGIDVPLNWQPTYAGQLITRRVLKDNGVKYWYIRYGDTRVEIEGSEGMEARPPIEQVRPAILKAIQQHDDADKELSILNDLKRLEGKKVWASDELSRPHKRWPWSR